MPQDVTEQTGSSNTSVKDRPIPRKWAKLAAQAEKDLKVNSMILDDTAPTGLASDNTLRTRGFVSGPQGGEKLKAPYAGPQVKKFKK